MDGATVFTAVAAAELLERPPRDRLLIIVFTADWCEPCHQMDRSTWPEPELSAWMAEHVVAVKVDVDKQRDISSRFGVAAMPTVLVMRDGVEVDRVAGARPARVMLEWLRGVADGHTERERLEKNLDPTDLSGRLAVARQLRSTGSFDEALDHCLWLWDHSLEVNPSWVGPRISFLIAELEQLVARQPRARKEVESRRDAVVDRAAGSVAVDGPERRDWIALNEALRDDASTLAWFDEIRGDLPSERAEVHRLRLFRLLKKYDRWVDIPLLFTDPFAALERQLGGSPPVPEDAPQAMKDALRKSNVTFAGDIVRAYVASGEQERAAELAARARELDTSAEVDNTVAAALAGT